MPSQPGLASSSRARESGGGIGGGLGIGLGGRAGGSGGGAAAGPPPPPPTSRTASRSRPCDTCRIRKTRCVKEDNQARCVLCTFHDQQCTYLRGPTPRQQRRPSPDTQGSGDHQRLSASPKDIEFVASEIGTQHSSSATISNTATPAAASSHKAQDAPTGRQKKRVRLAANSHITSRPAVLNGTLGLDLATHSTYIGPTDYREPVLMDLHWPEQFADQRIPIQTATAAAAAAGDGLIRRLSDRAVFLIYSDEYTTQETQRIADLDAIEATVQPLGRTLVDLYFRIVHPNFPILHKKVFLDKHADSHLHFAPSLLAAVYLVALDWQLYDTTLVSGAGGHGEPDRARLEELAERAMTDDVKRPKLSTLQAGLLLLQCCRRSTSGDWPFAAQMIAVAQGLGLHLDCSSWSLPEWEKGLRRRLGWALFLQDRWGAFLHGRPPMMHEDDWDLQPCSPADFPEMLENLVTDAEEASPSNSNPNTPATGSVDIDSGRELFMRHIELAQILSDVMRLFYSAKATKPGGTLDCLGPVAVVEMAKPFVLRLRKWLTDLPECLQVDTESSATRSRPPMTDFSLCGSGSLYLAHAATEIALHRALVRALTPEAPVELHAAVRAAARTRLQAAINLMASLRPEHMASFWGGAASHQVATIGGLAGLLWATTESMEETSWCVARAEELRWALRVRAAAAPFAKTALRLLEGSIGSLRVVRHGVYNSTSGTLGV
jgi:hypothetical protein